MGYHTNSAHDRLRLGVLDKAEGQAAPRRRCRFGGFGSGVARWTTGGHGKEECRLQLR